MSGEIVFRPMKESDLAKAARIEALSSPDAWSEKAFRDALLSPDTLYAVAEQDGCVVGCCGLWRFLEEADICNVAVLSSCRRQGIGTGMLRYLMEWGRRQGVRRFTLEVRKGNLAAVGLYEKLGFVVEGKRRDFYQNPRDDALILWKRS